MAEARRHQLDPSLVLAVMHIESLYDTYAVSNKDAMGLMQILPRTARGIGYLDALPTEQVQGKIQPGWINCHPRVRAARDEANSLRDRSTNRSLQLANEAALAQVEQHLAEVRDRAARV